MAESIGDLYGQAQSGYSGVSGLGALIDTPPTTDPGGLLGATMPTVTQPFEGYGPAVVAAYNDAVDNNNGLGLDFYGMSQNAGNSAAVAAMTPAQQAQYQTAVASGNGGFWGDVNKYAPYALLAVAAAATGGAAAGALGGGLGGAVAGGATAGAVSTAGGDAIAGKPLTLGSVGKGALVGAAGGGLTYAASPLTTDLTKAGVPAPVASTLVKTGTGAAAGALGGEIGGQGAAAGAEAGAAHGALSGSTNAVAGSVFGGNSTIFNSGDAAAPTSNTSLSNPVAPQTTSNMDTPDFTTDDDGPITTTTPGLDAPPTFQDPGLANPGDSSLNIQSGGTGTGGNSSLLGQLAALLGGGSSGSSGISPSLLTSLLGLGANAAGGALDSTAAKNAANTFAGETAYNPYTINGPGGTTSYNGTTATSSLSPQNQQLSTMLSGLAGSSGSALTAGPGADTTANFNALQSGDLQAQQRLLGNTQDNEFANGVLGSTAGGYQTQGALQAIGAQTGQNYSTASSLANTQQQQQLAQLTAGLNGTNQINQTQLQQLQDSLQSGALASNANQGAYKPALAANSNSTFGNILNGLGTAAQSPSFVNSGG